MHPCTPWFGSASAEEQYTDELIEQILENYTFKFEPEVRLKLKHRCGHSWQIKWPWRVTARMSSYPFWQHHQPSSSKRVALLAPPAANGCSRELGMICRFLSSRSSCTSSLGPQDPRQLACWPHQECQLQLNQTSSCLNASLSVTHPLSLCGVLQASRLHCVCLLQQAMDSTEPLAVHSECSTHVTTFHHGTYLDSAAILLCNAAVQYTVQHS
jgi:hypothetical protein